MKPTICTTLAAVAASTILAHAAPGDLNPAFDLDGKVTTSFSGDGDVATAVITVGGKLIVAGVSGFVDEQVFGLARYNADGSPDNTFGNSGRMTTDFPGKFAAARSVAFRPADPAVRDPDMIIVAGDASIGTNADFAIARYRTNGVLLTGGTTTTDFGGNDRAGAMVTQSIPNTSSFKILLAGSTDVNFNLRGDDFALARYTASGALDTTFDFDGKVVTDISSANDACLAIALQADGRIVAGGFGGGSGIAARFVLCRYNSDGSLDDTFGTLGKVVVNFPGVTNSGCRSIALLPGGKILAVGDNDDLTISSLLAQLNPDGSLDTSFGSGGTVVTSASTAALDVVHAVAVQGDGKILLAGRTLEGASTTNFAVVRYSANGKLDKGFGVGGRATVDFGTGFGEAFGLLVRGDGTIVAVGYDGFDPGNFALASFKTAQGDARVNLSGEIPRGDDRYNTTGAGQTQSAAIPRDGGVKNVLIGIQNDTAAIDSFTVRGTPGNSRFKVKYLHGSDNVTAQMLNGTLTTGPLAPGAIYQLKARITAATSVKGKTRDFSITPTSAADPTAKDRVLIKARSK
ncbi:MAG: hypothetical protein V4819_18820 [Verrucomicrobiota bacterium]